MKSNSLKSKAYNYIKEKIIKCEFEPGTFLDEKSLISELGASRTPIREALYKIEEEGFIQIIPKKGIIVTQITMKNILEVFQVREIIEPVAIEKYGQNLSIERLNYFKEVYTRRDFDEDFAHGLDDDFHKFIVSAYKNEYMDNLIEDIQDQNQRIRLMSGKLGSPIEVTFNEHLRIISLVENLELKKSADELLNHIQASKRRATERFF